MGLDRLTSASLLVLLTAAACSHNGGRPTHLLDGRPAPAFAPVPGSVVAAARLLQHSDVDDCLAPADRSSVRADALVVERVGVDGRSLTFATANGTGVVACDGGADAAGERAPPWCATVFGELVHGRLLDPRLDVLCRDRERRPLAYAFVEPVAGAHWIGVQQDGYVELYEVLAELPVRVATTHGVDAENARAALELTEYDVDGRLLVHQTMEAAVAG